MPVIVIILLLFSCLTGVDAQRRRSTRRSTPRLNARGYSQLAGTYQLNTARSDNPRDIANRAAQSLPPDVQQSEIDRLSSRLQSPDVLVIDRRGNSVTIGSSIAPRITLVADGQEHLEQLSNGRSIRTSASFIGERLEIHVTGNSGSNFDVSFTPVNNGNSLTMTRSIDSQQIQSPISAHSYYDRTSTIAQWGMTGQGSSNTAYNNGNNGNYNQNPNGNYNQNNGNNRNDNRNPNGYYNQNNGNYVIPSGTILVTRLNESLISNTSQQNDRFTLTVNSPRQYSGDVIEGHVSAIDQSGKLTGRTQMTLSFDQIRLANGSTYPFAGYLTGVRTSDGKTLRVNNEGTVQGGNQTTKTEERAAIGTGIGAIIGAIAGGGKGALIGGILGAGGGAGSVYIQGQNNLNLSQGTQITVQTTGPANR
jgi:hypothetical protein